jgi:ribose 5-phosphate isomerase B
MAADHAGYEMKEFVKSLLISQGYEVKDFGTYSNESCDYPDFAHQLGNAVDDGSITEAIAFCGSGNGINITLNKHSKVRSAYCWNEDIARLARQHNDANICAIPARFLSPEVVGSIVEAFLSTGFEGGRHQRRVDKISNY